MRTFFFLFVCPFFSVAMISHGTTRPMIWVDDSDRADAEFSNDEFSFKGRFAVLSEVNDEPEYIYLGDAVSASFKGWNVSFADGNPGAADIRFKEGVPSVNAVRKLIITKEK